MKKIMSFVGSFMIALFIAGNAFAQEALPPLPDIDLKSASKFVFITLISFLALKSLSDLLSKIAERTATATDNKVAALLAKIVTILGKLIDQFIGNSRTSATDKK